MRLQVGFNYAWSTNRFGYDIGPDPHYELTKNPEERIKIWLNEERLANQGKFSEIPLPPLFKHIDRNLKNLNKMGIKVVRFFLLGNGLNYVGMGPVRRNIPSPNPPINFFDYLFLPRLVTDKRFIYHFDNLLQRFKDSNTGIKIIPSLISFEFTGPFKGRDGLGLAVGGHADCIKNRNIRQRFLGTILNDLLNVSQKYKEQIYAWEVINEPYWDITPFSVLGFRVPEVTVVEKKDGKSQIVIPPKDVMDEFLFDATQIIERKGFSSTVGHRFFSDINNSNESFAFRGNKPQFHYYAKPLDPNKIEGAGLFSGNPKPFLGEFASSLHQERDRNGNLVLAPRWPEFDKNNDTTLNRLKLLDKEGCLLALIWPDVSDKEGSDEEKRNILENDPIKLKQETRKDIVEFTGGEMPSPNE